MACANIAAIRSIESLSDVEAAYIAGLMDADGTVTVSICSGHATFVKSLPVPLVLIVNSDLGLIRWLKEKIGAGCSYQTKTKPTRPDQNQANWNPVHRYQITNGIAQRLLTRLRPFMRVKAAQVDLVLQLPIRGRDFAQRASEQQREHAYWIVGEIRRLNQRGKKDSHQFTLSALMAGTRAF